MTAEVEGIDNGGVVMYRGGVYDEFIRVEFETLGGVL
jgi:hypothetical protein